MEVTEVRVFLSDEDRLKAYVTVTFDNCFVVRDLKVIEGNNGLFVAMPSKKRKDGTYKDIAHPIHSDFRQALEKIIMDKYQDEAKMVEAGFKTPREREATQDDLFEEVNQISVVAPYNSSRDFEAGIGPAGLKK